MRSVYILSAATLNTALLDPKPSSHSGYSIRRITAVLFHLQTESSAVALAAFYTVTVCRRSAQYVNGLTTIDLCISA